MLLETALTCLRYHRNNLDRCLQEAESLEHELNVMKNRISKIEPQLKSVTKQRDDYKDQYDNIKRRLNSLKEEVVWIFKFIPTILVVEELGF